MEKQPKTTLMLGKKRKRKSSDISSSGLKTIKVDSPAKTKEEIVLSPEKELNVSISEPTPETVTEAETVKGVDSSRPKKQHASVKKTCLPNQGLTIEEMGEKYPILNNKEVIDRFMKLPFSNNQKGRIRQAIKAQLQGSDNTISAEILHGKIQTILKSKENLGDSDLRRVRILYNMLKTALEPTEEKPKEKNKKKRKKNKVPKEKGEGEKEEKAEEKEQSVNKVKGPKRYVVFVGNLPIDVDKEKVMKHFADINEHIKDIRIPKQKEGKKSAIAFLEVNNETTYEMALSKHHSMLDNKRINVMYSTQQNSKITKSEAKGKVAKLIALQKSGKLAGSTAMNKKRTHRRNIAKRAKAKEVAAENA